MYYVYDHHYGALLRVTCFFICRSYCYDTIRATLPTMTLDNAFESKDEVSTNLKLHLEAVMHDNGYTILQALVTDLVSYNSRVAVVMSVCI